MAGSVYKRGDIWYIRYDLPPGADGKRRQAKRSCPGKSKTEAELQLSKIIVDISKGSTMNPENLTMTEYLATWLERLTPDISPTTAVAYESNLRLHIAPALGRCKLGALKPIHIQTFYDHLELSPKSIKNIHGILHCALDEALRLDLISSNPADRVKVPKVIRPRIKTAANQDIPKLLRAIDQSKYRIPILIAMATGARRGEVLALKWSDFDEDRGLLDIRRAVVKVTGRLIYKSTKSGNDRIVGLPPTMIMELLKHKEHQEQWKAQLGNAYQDGAWICADADGRAQTPGGLAAAYVRLRRAVGVEVTLHGLRHTLISESLTAGVPSEIVSKRAGHSTIAITHDIYGHVLPQHQQAAIDVAEKLITMKPKIKLVNE